MSAPRSPVRVAVLDDRTLIASGLTELLGRARGVRVIDEGALVPGDVVLAGVGTAFTPTRLGVRRVELSVEWTFDDVVRAVVRTVSRDGHSRRRGQPLSRREQIILNMTSNGSSAAQIARQLDVSVRTVERHRRAVVDKLAARSSTHAVAVAPVTDAIVDSRSE